MNKLFYYGWRGYQMYRSTMCFAKGVGTGILACAVVTILSSRAMKKSRHFRHKTHRVLDAAGDLMHNVEYMFR